MSKKDEALKLALEALEPLVKRAAPWGELDWLNGCKAITALREALAEQPAQQALNKMAQNARDIGLDYEPSSGTQVSKVWWDGEKLMEKQVPLEDFYKPAQQEPVAWLKVIETPGGWGKFVEAKPHEKGAKPVYTFPPAQQGQVAWTLLLTGEHHGLVGKAGEKFVGHPEHYERVDVYTSPRRTWVGLTAMEIEAIGKPYEEKDRSIRAWGLFACAIEANLREKNT